MFNFSACLMVFWGGGCVALYESNSDVIELTESNFDRLVTQSDDVWVVEFYAPWCGHCQSFAPEYSKAAKALKVRPLTFSLTITNVPI
jgi:protein disulfide-isomerase A6